MVSQNSSNSSNATSTVSLPIMIENCKPPELKRMNNCSSHALLKQDKLNMIAEKLDSFIEQTNKKLIELSNRLDVIESSLFSGATSEGKRKNNSIEGQENSKTKKKKLPVTVELPEDEEKLNTTTKVITSKSKPQREILEEVDSPWDNNKPSSKGFIVDSYGYVIVYTDGACTNNGRRGAKAGVGVWFNHSNPFNVAAPVDGNATNNNAEIQAATRAIQQASLAGITRLNIHTDSQFMINCMTNWIKKWKKNKWVTTNGGPVKNKEQLEILDNAIRSLYDVKWTHIRGHVGVEGNECADALARSGAEQYYTTDLTA